MTKKRKINYAELLKADATGPVPEPTPMPQPLPAPEPSPLPAPTPAPEPVPVPDELPVPSGPAPDVAGTRAPEQAAAPKPAQAKPPARATTRRRRADNAESPRELASALNERAAFERQQRAEALAAAEPSSESAPAAGGPPRDQDAAAAPVEHHPAGAPRTGSARADAPAADAVEAEASARPSAAVRAVGGDTMEFAVANAVQALPFRERAKARLGRAELLLFSVGRELFATPLSAVEEAIELAEIRPIPEMSASMLGVTELRGRMIPIYSPSRSLGVDLGAAPAAALIVHTGERRIALAVDDVEDVLELDLAELRDAPGTDDLDGVLVGVARRGRQLVAVVDGESLVVACLTDQVPETA